MSKFVERYEQPFLRHYPRQPPGPLPAQGRGLHKWQCQTGLPPSRVPRAQVGVEREQVTPQGSRRKAGRSD